jgi:hypothetical protein
MFLAMSASTTSTPRVAHPDADADIDRYLRDNHDDFAAKLAAARDQIAAGDATPLEPLDALLREARSAS